MDRLTGAMWRHEPPATPGDERNGEEQQKRDGDEKHDEARRLREVCQQ